MSQYTCIDDVRGDERIDSRDLIELCATMVEELHAIEQDGAAEEYEGQAAELREGIAAISELEKVGVDDWQYGATLIAEWTFEDYAQELAEDTFPFPAGSEAAQVLDMWPYRYIDWERAARDLRMDYTSVTFLGYEYLVRA